MVNLGDLTKLLNQGHVTDEHVYKSEDGDYKFKLKTITPLEDVSAQNDASTASSKANVNEGDGSTHTTFYAIEVLSRAIDTVNDVPLESVPGLEGSTGLDKRRYAVEKLGEKLMLDLWKKYNEMRANIILDGTEEENEAVKK